MLKTGDFVTHLKVSEWGIGEIIDDSDQYLQVYFPEIDDNKDFPKNNNFLAKETSLSADNKNVQKFKDRNNNKHLQFSDRIVRDHANAVKAQEFAKQDLRQSTGFREQTDITGGPSEEYLKAQKRQQEHVSSLQAISKVPFHLMIEADVVTQDNNRDKQLLYANEYSIGNKPLGSVDERINILAWTHPAVQLCLTRELREEADIQSNGYTLRAVTPLARATFSQVLPDIAGLYEPGGSVGEKEKYRQRTGLKAVKLKMTKAQVDAFLSKMDGMLLVSGAPGSGKTTVAMQRIRFLFDQQEVRQEERENVAYSPELTKIFLANQNLIDYSKLMLEKELQISSSVVELVGTFVHRYLTEIWSYKHKAKIRKKKLSFYDRRGREAFFGLCNVSQLKDCWETFEYQISERLEEALEAQWISDVNGQVALKSDQLARALQAYSMKSISSNPLSSLFKMDSVYRYVERRYENLRELHREQGTLEKFDLQFQQWLYWVYDPFDGIESYFLEEAYAGKIRIKNGIAAKIVEDDIMANIKEDWQKRTYGPEAEPWLAFLLRFSLPVELENKSRFREMANPLDIVYQHSGERWTHVMVDEAQDLCVAEAALLGSFVHPKGAFTVSADFHQVVSPVWGMENSEAFNIGSSLKGEEQLFPFAKNMRQSKQIGMFLKEFYHSAFGEIAPFEASTEIDIKNGMPLLMLGNPSEFPMKIKQRLAVLRRNPDLQSIALLQINEDENAMEQLRSYLKEQGVALAPIWQPTDGGNRLITTSVERIKGLEYDACFIIGMDDLDSSTLQYAKNRAYVALSRPALQLTIFCEEIPKYLQKIKSDYMKIVNI